MWPGRHFLPDWEPAGNSVDALLKHFHTMMNCRLSLKRISCCLHHHWLQLLRPGTVTALINALEQFNHSVCTHCLKVCGLFRTFSNICINITKIIITKLDKEDLSMDINKTNKKHQFGFKTLCRTSFSTSVTKCWPPLSRKLWCQGNTTQK